MFLMCVRCGENAIFNVQLQQKQLCKSFQKCTLSHKTANPIFLNFLQLPSSSPPAFSLHYLQLSKSRHNLRQVKHGVSQNDSDSGEPKRPLQQPHGSDHQRSRGQSYSLQPGFRIVLFVDSVFSKRLSECVKRISDDRDHQRGQR